MLGLGPVAHHRGHPLGGPTGHCSVHFPRFIYLTYYFPTVNLAVWRFVHLYCAAVDLAAVAVFPAEVLGPCVHYKSTF